MFRDYSTRTVDDSVIKMTFRANFGVSPELDNGTRPTVTLQMAPPEAGTRDDQPPPAHPQQKSDRRDDRVA